MYVSPLLPKILVEEGRSQKSGRESKNSMAEVTSGGSDEVAVDIEVFEDCDTQLGSSSPEDEIEEIVFRREDLNPDWISSIKGKILLEPEKMKSSSASESCSIHRVPSWLRRKNSDAYDPKVISIGPLHYKEREGELRAMEEHKWKYLHTIVSRKHEDEGQAWLEDCLATVKRLEKRARNCYSEVIPLDSDSFVEMTVLDGCFILELFRRDFKKVFDVIFRLDWLRHAILYDLLLMENQIPFFILQRLSVLIDPSGPSLEESTINFFYENYLTILSRINASDIRIRHLLHFKHTVHVLCLSDEFTRSTEKTPRIDCASKLAESGIKFRKRDVGESNFLDITFNKGVTEIPAINVWDKTERENLNLIAFEQCYPHCTSYITAYQLFMDCLINTAKDVDILCREGIIANRLGNEELVASHFNSMVREATNFTDEFYLSDVCEKINEYSQRRWPRLRASLVHDYFNNPWAIISFLAAVLLLLLTLTQTFFTSFLKFAAEN